MTFNKEKQMKEELIQWPCATYWDKPWNPIQGCTPVSPACEHCYAKSFADRYKQSFSPHKTTRKSPPTKGVVFCGNATDLFGDWVDLGEDYIGKTLGHHDAEYLWLTKRPSNMVKAIKSGTEFIKGDNDGLFPFSNENLENHLFGFTAENQEWYDRRFEEFKEVFTMSGVNTWLSAEPLLGPINLRSNEVFADCPYDMIPFKWVVVGCESGSNRRNCEIEWVESIVDQCRTNKVPVFVKQICLPDGSFTNKIEDFPEHLRIRQVPWTKK